MCSKIIVFPVKTFNTGGRQGRQGGREGGFTPEAPTVPRSPLEEYKIMKLLMLQNKRLYCGETYSVCEAQVVCVTVEQCDQRVQEM